ncbi:MAG TPA: BTAD domain-containing putative transcriptional regulator [Gemmatimonadales bacterium]|nr:BTAD domain-containing putative transcriptional regulator [Gemmatimonadales bacterium]
MQLRTFGGLWIEGTPARPALQPRQLAVLALIGAAGRKGISRDRAIGILWSETEEEQARHTLSQTLYSLRRDTGAELVQGTTSLRLAPALTSDVGALEEALSRGELDAVADLYTGRFLEGFYLPAAPEFERWVEEERSRLHRAAVGALERLAAKADSAPNHTDAVRLWQRLAELDPLSARYTAGCMRALAAAGDRPHALAQARRYAETLRKELDAEPDPAIVRLEAELRAGSGAVPARVTRPPAATPVEVRAPVIPEAATATTTTVTTLVTIPRWRWLLPSAIVALLLVAVALQLASRSSGSHLPFIAVGKIQVEPSADSARPGAILRDMLSTSLGGIEGLQVVANSRLVELMSPGAEPTAAILSDAARRAGATEVIEGELTSERGALVFSLRRVAIPGGIVRKGYIIRAADRFAMVDSATAAIARDLRLAPPSVAVAEMRTASPVAYALYEEGLRAFYGYDSPAAYRLMKAALERDSSFAMAAYYVWSLSRGLADGPTQAESMTRAKHLAVRTTERERLLILGSIAEVDAPLGQALAIAETLTVKYPSDPEGHILLGAIQERAGSWSEAVGAYQRAVTLDSAAGNVLGPYCRICSALYGMARAYSWWDSAAAGERTARRLIALRPDEPAHWDGLVEPLLRQGRHQEAMDAWVKAHPNGASGTLDPIFYRDDIRWGRHAVVEPALRQEAAGSSEDLRREAWWLLQLSFRDQGRLREADSVRRTWRAADLARNPRAVNPRPDALMIGMEMGRPEISIRTLRIDAELTARSKDPPGIRSRYLAWFLTLAGTAYAAAGDTDVVRRLADSVETLGQHSQFGRDARLHYFLRGLLFQRQGRHADAVDAFRRALFSLTDGYTRINLMLARSLLELHRPEEAVTVLRPAIHGGVDGSNTYASRTDLHEALAQAFEQAGQADSARTHWRLVESTWRHADPQFRERYLAAKSKAGN